MGEFNNVHIYLHKYSFNLAFCWARAYFTDLSKKLFLYIKQRFLLTTFVWKAPDKND